MLILKGCTDYGIVPMIKIIRTIFLMLQIIGPTLAIVSIGIIIFGAISAGDMRKIGEQKKKIINSFIALLITVFLPILVNLVMNITQVQDSFQVAACWDEAYNTKLEGNGDYLEEEQNDDDVNTFVINPEQYNNQGIDNNPNSGNSSSEFDDDHGNTSSPDVSSTGALGAVEWAKKIAADDSFTYGKPKSAGGYANRGGCYFCGSNNKKVELSGGDKRYYKTYMCQSYITAAYAHGANDPAMLKLCKNHKVLKCNDTAYQNYSCWEFVGRAKDLKESDLKPGDVLITWETHMAMYIGNGDTIDARSTDYWGANSIAIRKGAIKKFLKHKDKSFVMRYKGN